MDDGELSKLINGVQLFRLEIQRIAGRMKEAAKGYAGVLERLEAAGYEFHAGDIEAGLVGVQENLTDVDESAKDAVEMIFRRLGQQDAKRVKERRGRYRARKKRMNGSG